MRQRPPLFVGVIGFVLALFALWGVINAAVAQSGAPRVTTLAGAEEVSIDGQLNAGDPDGIGAAAFWINQGQGQLCWEVNYANISAPFAAHLHVARAGSVGVVAVTLAPLASGCTGDIDADLLKDLIQNPQSYYVNIHTPDFPGGALRGQINNRGHNP